MINNESSNFFICGTSYFARRIENSFCPYCKKNRRTVILYSTWYEPDVTCLTCGDVRLPRPNAKRREDFNRTIRRNTTLKRCREYIKILPKFSRKVLESALNKELDADK